MSKAPDITDNVNRKTKALYEEIHKRDTRIKKLTTEVANLKFANKRLKETLNIMYTKPKKIAPDGPPHFKDGNYLA